MTTYQQPVDYRKLYESYYGPIPTDDLGRTYHIHHIDGDRTNNDISNLVAVSIENHYRIHKEQGDHAACLKLAKLLNISKEEISHHARENQLNRVRKGTHTFTSEMAFARNQRWRESDDWHLLGGEHQKRIAQERVKNGTHNFQDPEIMKSHREKIWAPRTCPVCNREGRGPRFIHHIKICERP